MCGREAVVVGEEALHLCAEHARDYSVYRCEACDALCTTHGATPDDRSCTTCRIERALSALSEEELAPVDEALSRRRIIPAIRELRRNLHMSLGDAEYAVHLRAHQIGHPITHELRPPTEAEMLGQLVAMSPVPQAIQARWDGDTQGWMVSLEAVLRDGHGYRTRQLGVMRGRGGDMRSFDGEVPGWPEAAWASAVGASLARRIGVPFHFGSPDGPDDEAPNWWETRG
jgi:hypothetical protein